MSLQDWQKRVSNIFLSIIFNSFIGRMKKKKRLKRLKLLLLLQYYQQLDLALEEEDFSEEVLKDKILLRL